MHAQLLCHLASWKEQKKDGALPAAGIIPTAPGEQVHTLFQSCVYQLAEAIIRDLQVVVYNDAANMCRPYLIPPEVLQVWLTECAQPSTRKSFIKCYDPKEEEFAPPDLTAYWAEVGLMGTIEVMRAPLWKEHADLFGGERWEDIARHFAALVDAYKTESKRRLPSPWIEFTRQRTTPGCWCPSWNGSGFRKKSWKPGQRYALRRITLPLSPSSLGIFFASPQIRIKTNFRWAS